MPADTTRGQLDLLLLACLEPREAHGYALIEALRERSGGRFDLPEGTVYPALHRLEDRGLLRSRWAGEGRRRRLYELTTAGRERLRRSRREWQAHARAVASVVDSR
jgi:PadR family transcriptional regulator PadR